MTIFELFLEEKKDIREDYFVMLKRFYNKLESVIPENKTVDLLEKNDCYKILTALKPKSKRGFVTTKSQIKVFFDWCVSRGYMTQEQVNDFAKIQYQEIESEEVYTQYFFINFVELYNALENSLKYHCEDIDVGEEWDSVRCAVYLAWHGFDAEEMPKILKSDVSMTSNVIYRRSNDEVQAVPISPLCMPIIHRYVQAENYISNRYKSREAVFRYQPSEFLFRSYKNSSMTKSRMVYLTKYVNEHGEKLGHNFHLDRIYKNGMYHRMFLSEQNEGEITAKQLDRIQKFFPLTENQKANRNARYIRLHHVMSEYKKYKSFMIKMSDDICKV